MRKKVLLALGVLSISAGLAFGMPNMAYAASETATVSDSSEYTGWEENADGTMSYYQDGELVCDKVIQIGSSYYGFDYEGKMYKNTTFWSYDYENWMSKCYRASESGELYQSQWYQDEWEYWYYYTEDASAANGILQIGDCKYSFYSDGQLMVNTTVSTEEGNFVANSQGVLTEVKNNGWTKVGNYWYYVKNGIFCNQEIVKIDNKYYVFDWQGRMGSDGYYWGWDSEKEEGYYVIARENGVLYQNQWVNYSDSWYYADKNCKLAQGVKKINGQKYLFNDYGVMIENAAIVVDEVSYAAADNGIAVKLANNTWTKVGNYWYYVKNNQYIYDKVVVISGSYYAFDYNGRMVSDERYSVYNSETESWDYYRAKADGTLYKGQWYKDKYGEWYYYGKDCKQYIGLCKIGGKQYYFNTYSGMYVSTTVYVDNAYYCADKDGVLTKLKNNKWTSVDGYWYYVKDNTLPYNEIVLIGDKYYGFDYNSRMRVNERFYAYKYAEDDSYTYGYHRAKADGTLCKNEWYYNSEDDTWEYYDKNTVGLNGINKINGKKYYFYDGTLKESGVAYTEDYRPYLIGKDGVLVTGKKGWYSYNGEWYYMNEDGSLYAGILKLDDKMYYMDYAMVHNSNYIRLEGKLYQAKDDTGVLKKIKAEGAYTDTYETYYVANGKLYNGWKKLDGEWRYFDEYGEMVKDYNGYYIDGKYYAFDEHGAMYSNGWIDDYYYATSSGELAVGKYTIDGKKYVFSDYGYLYTSYYSDNGKYTIKGITYKFNQGWNKADGKWYYLKDGELFYGRNTIDGKDYYFEYAMVTDVLRDGIYYGKDGAAVKGWFKLDGNWYYADENYHIAYGLTTIDGVKYYFMQGRMATSDVLDSRTIYRIGTNGVVKETVEVKDGWNYVGCEAYYFKDNEQYTGWLGNSYISYGTKVFNSKIYDSEYEAYYYINKDGKYVTNTWVKPYESSDLYYYAGSDGKLKRNEWATINGSWYYFDSYCEMYTGLLVDEGTTYFLDRNGKLIKTFGKISNGWHKLDGNWLYAINGKFVVGRTAYINGKFYSFRSDGIMLTESLGSRTYDSNGVMKTGKGWFSTYGYWFYLGYEGKYTSSGWLELNGKKYYVDAVMRTGYNVIDGKLYYFDNNGVCKGTKGVKNGWYQADGDWYYFENSKVITDRVMIIDGARYAFGYDGRMVTNAVYTDDRISYYYGMDYFFGSDGKAVTKAGIYKTANGGKVYVSANGEAHTGAVYVNGKIQYMGGNN